MTRRRLGRSGLEVGAIGMGCWAIGGPFWDRGGWMGYGDVDDGESVRAVRRALELGATLFDTADVYGCGHSERVLGRALADHRDEAVLAVKFGYTFDEASRTVTGRDISPAGIRAACEASLRRLGTDRIDLYQLHLFDLPANDALAVADTLDELIAEGKIRWHSWCCEDAARVGLFAARPHCAALPMLVNPLHADAALLELAEAQDLACIARRPLGMGLLTGKFHAASELPANDMRRRFGWDFRNGQQALQLSKLEAVRELLTQGGRTLAQGALCWGLARSLRVIPIPGFKTVAQVEENLGAVRFGPLPTETMPAIHDLLAAIDAESSPRPSVG